MYQQQQHRPGPGGLGPVGGDGAPAGRSSEKKMCLSRRNHLKSLLLHVGQVMLEEEAEQMEEEKMRHMEENCPSLGVPGCLQDLQDLCRRLHKQIDLVDEERYDVELKVTKSTKEISDLKTKVQDLKGKFRKPVLRRVRMSADAMLAVLLGSKHKVSLDLRNNLRQVKKESREEDKTSNWRKNVEDKSNMDGRKKMFEEKVLF